MLYLLKLKAKKGIRVSKICLAKRAFTLAEVLITLGIIGIVAAMTIPTLIKNIQEQQFKAAAKKAFSVSAQAIESMREDQGGNFDYFFGNAGSFKPVFMTYFQVIKDCNNSDCVASLESSTVYKSLYGSNANTQLMDEGQFITNDGILFGIQNSTSTVNGIMITADVNGDLKGPNTFGKDVFMFQIKNDTLKPMGAPTTNYLSSTYCDRTLDNAHQGKGCMALVMQGTDY